jgi:chlorite dismutase
MTGKDEDEDDIAGKDEDDMAGKDEDENDMAGKDADVLTMIQRDEMADEHTSKTDMRTSAIEPKEPTKFWHSVS